MIINLPLQSLRDLMFGYPEYFGDRPISVTQREPEAHYPKMIPRQLGEILIELDKQNSKPVFHIILYPSHAEIWDAYEWQLSASRKWSIIEQSNIRSEKYLALNGEIAAKQALFFKVKKHLIDINVIPEPVRANAVMCDQLVRVLMNSPKSITKNFDGLTELLYGDIEESPSQCAGEGSTDCEQHQEPVL
jgi:hypothetical protein